MNAKDIWYGVLEAGEKSSPVVRDATLDADQNRVYLYNYVRNQFIEYSLAIVEPKLRELTAEDITLDELDKAFKSARLTFTSSRKGNSLSDIKQPAPNSKNDDDEIDFDISDDDDMEEFIDDDD